jgi:hypothetical protein
MRIALAGLLISFLAVAELVHAEDIPTPPLTLKDAQTLGMHRMSVDDMKAFIPGAIVRLGPNGEKHKLIFRSSGSVLRVGDKGGRERGYWRFDSRREVYCESFRGRKGGCFAVFMPDTKHLFDYRINNGHYVHTWWKA